MRILHTADWHLNHRLGRIERNEDIARRLRQIAGYLAEYQVDVMVVAGDLFERGRAEELRQGVALIREIFLPYLQGGGTIVAISGNHDSEIFFETLRDAFDLVMPIKSANRMQDPSQPQRNGRLYIAANPTLLRLADRNGTVVQFVLMPYPTVRAYLRGEPVQYRSVEEKYRAIQDKFTRTLALLQQPSHGFDQTQQAVLVSHVHVRGVDPHPLFHLIEADDIVFETSDIPTHWAYVAYGHIHKAQPIRQNSDHVRYAGSVERLNLGEANDKKSVVLLEIGKEGIIGKVQCLPLDATPIHHIEISDPIAQLPLLRAQYPDAERALVRYTLHWQAGEHSRDALCREIETIFPRWYERTLRQVGTESLVNEATPIQQIDNVVGNVRDYLQMNLGQRADWEAIFALAEELLAQEVTIEETE